MRIHVVCDHYPRHRVLETNSNITSMQSSLSLALTVSIDIKRKFIILTVQITQTIQKRNAKLQNKNNKNRNAYI